MEAVRVDTLDDPRSMIAKLLIPPWLPRSANGGAEITKLVGTSAWYAPGAAAAEMAEAILKDKKKILPRSVSSACL